MTGVFPSYPFRPRVAPFGCAVFGPL